MKSSCSFHANGRRASFIIQGAHKRLAAPDYVTPNKAEIGEKTWQIVVIRQFRQSFFSAKVFYCTVYHYHA